MAASDHLHVLAYKDKRNETQDNLEMRVKIESKGCELGEGYLCFRLGRAHYFGKGARKDLVKAKQLMLRACETEGDACAFAASNFYGCAAPTPDASQFVALLKKGCSIGSKEACEDARNPSCMPASFVDLVSAPASWAGKTVGLTKVMVRRLSPSSGIVYPPGGSAAADGVNASLAEGAGPETRKAWFALPSATGVEVARILCDVREGPLSATRVDLRVDDIWLAER